MASESEAWLENVAGLTLTGTPGVEAVALLSAVGHCPWDYNTASSIFDRPVQTTTTMAIQKKASVSEQYCKQLLDKDAEVPDACKRFASIKAQLDAKADPYVGMTPGAQSAVRNAQIKRRMSTRHNQGKEGKRSSWF